VYLLTKPDEQFTVRNVRDIEAQANAWSQNPEHQKVIAQLKPLLSGIPVRDTCKIRTHRFPWDVGGALLVILSLENRGV